MRIVIDTNVWISYLIGGYLRETLDNKILSNEIKILFSEDMLKEFFEVVSRPKFKKIFSEKRIKELVILMRKFEETIQIKERINICRDPKDNLILETAVSGKANLIITGDEDLLSLSPFRNIRIITPAKFEKNL